MAREDGNGPFRELQHGRTRHGFEYLQAARKDWPTSYYGPHSGVAIALNALDKPNRRIAVVGLGAGTLAAWGRPGDTVSLLRNQSRRGADRADLVFLPRRLKGANRSRLRRRARATGTGIGVRTLPGFRLDRSGCVFQAIQYPMHLLTAESGDIYRRRLAPGGVLALHISNRALDLDPVARGMANYLGWRAVQINSTDDSTTGESAARWVLMTSNQGFLDRRQAGARPSVGLEQPRADHLDRRFLELVARVEILIARLSRHPVICGPTPESAATPTTPTATTLGA